MRRTKQLLSAGATLLLLAGASVAMPITVSAATPSAAPNAVASTVPAAAQTSAPPPATSTEPIVGTLQLRVFDPKPGTANHSETVAVIVTAKGTVPIDPTQVPTGMHTGARVRLSQPGAMLQVAPESPSTSGSTTGSTSGSTRIAPSPTVQGTQPALMVLVNWAGNPADSTTTAQATSELTANQSWYQSVSNGRLNMPGSTTGWITISAPTGSCGDGSYDFINTMETNTYAKLSALGYTPSNYSHIIMYFPDTSSQSNCDWAGVGDVGGGNSWINGTTDGQVLAHELGHNLGLNHAATLTCTEGSNDAAISGNCSAEEYGDYTDTMGAYAEAMFAAPHLTQLGWFAAGELATDTIPASSSTTTTTQLQPLEVAGLGVRAVKVPLPDGSALYFENRQQLGVDATEFNSAQVGVRVHFQPAPDANIPCTGTVPGNLCGADQFLLDPQAGLPTDDGSWILKPGVTMRTPDGEVVASVTNGSGNTMGLTLQLNAVTPTRPSITSVISGNGQVQLSWSAAPGFLGDTATNYLIESTDTNTSNTTTTLVSAASLSTTITGLTNGDTYTFRVTPWNPTGMGAASNYSTPVIVGIPSAPQSVTATASSQSAFLTWTAPTNNGGSAITGYVVTVYINGTKQGSLTMASTATSATVGGLTNGTTYTFTVAAQSATGLGIESAPSNAVTPMVTRPGTPTSVVAQTGQSQATLAWTAPANNGGSAITGYVITTFVNGVSQGTTTSPGNATTATITGLVNGTAYTFTVAAQNSVGLSAPSAPTGPVTPQAHTPNEAYVIAAYIDFLGVAPTPDDLAYYSGQLTSGMMTRQVFVTGLANSTQWIQHIVTQFYENTLNRPPDASGLQYWINQIRSGSNSVASVAANFYASPEYFQTIGQSNLTTWITDLYTKILNRSPEAGALNYWTSAANSRGRWWVAYSFYQSSESCHDRVAELYQELLGRAPDQTGWDYWATQVASVGDVALAINLSVSTEYYNRAFTRFG